VGLVLGAIALNNISRATQTNVPQSQDSESARDSSDQRLQQPAPPAVSLSQSLAASPSKTDRKLEKSSPQCDIATPEIDLALARAEIDEHAGRLSDAEAIYHFLMSCRAARGKASAGLKQIRLLRKARGQSAAQ
jgi:hypothetical protein